MENKVVLHNSRNLDQHNLLDLLKYAHDQGEKGDIKSAKDFVDFLATQLQFNRKKSAP